MLEELFSKILKMPLQEINVILSSDEDVLQVSKFMEDHPRITWVANDAFKANDQEYPIHNATVVSFQVDGIQFNFTSNEKSREAMFSNLRFVYPDSNV